jgi:CBS domain-containing protein
LAAQVNAMPQSIRRPEEILAYRPLKQILAAKPQALWTVAPADSVQTAMQLMAEKDIGVLVVIEDKDIAGILSERDCVRRLILAGKVPGTTSVADIMVRDVIKVDVTDTFGDCVRLMHQHRIRHLPVTEIGLPIGVVSIRDLLRETVAHHAKVIGELERERLTMFTSMA